MSHDGNGPTGPRVQYLFPHYKQEGGPSPAEVELLADRIQEQAGNLEVLRAEVEGQRRAAADGTAGQLREALDAGNAAQAANFRRILRRTLVTAAVTRLSGENGVRAYDRPVDDLRLEFNRRHAESIETVPEQVPVPYAPREQHADRLIEELRRRQESYLADPLEAEAALARSRLERDPEDDALLQELFAVGGLPPVVVAAFPDIQFTYRELPSDLAGLTDAELAAYLVEHPELAADVLPILDTDRRLGVAEWVADHLRAPGYAAGGGAIGLQRLAEAAGYESPDDLVLALRCPDLTAEDREAVLETIDELRQAGLIGPDDDPGQLYVAWLQSNLENGRSAEDIASWAADDANALEIILRLDDDIQAMSDGELAELLRTNPGAPPELIEMVRSTRPEVLEQVSGDWKLIEAGASATSGAPSIFNLPCVGDTEGYVVGPDGRTYEVVVPEPSDGPVMTDIISGGVDLAVAAAEGLSNAQRAEYGQHFAGQVIFQENVIIDPEET